MGIRILYTGSFRYPNLDAAAFRVNGVCELFSDHGCDIEIAGWENKYSSYTFEGFQCHPQNEFNDGKEKNAFKRFFSFIFRGFRTFNWIRKNNRFDLFVLYNPPALFSLIMLLWAKCSGRKVALDVTEWYESSHLIGGKFGLVSIENWFRMKVIYPMYNDIIVISTFLENYFKHKGCKNVVKCLPVAADKFETMRRQNVSVDSSVKFIYAGQPGRKDLLIDFISNLPELKKKLGKDVIFNLVGPEQEDFAKLYRISGRSFEDIKPFIKFHGFLSRDQVFDLYRKSDFSILFREDKRYAKAGFPTKGMESLTNGCPIVLNDVGDIAEIVRDIDGGIVCLPENSELIAYSILNQVFVKEEISQKARKYFGKEQYTILIGEFIRGVNRGHYRN